MSSGYVGPGGQWVTFTPQAANGPLFHRILAQRGAPANLTGVTTETLMIPEIEIPAGAMGPNACLRIESQWQQPANTNSRTMRIYIGPTLAGATLLWERIRTGATQLQETPLLMLVNRGVLNSQIVPANANTNYAVNQNATAFTRSFDFSVQQFIWVTGTLANGADTLTLDWFQVSIEG